MIKKDCDCYLKWPLHEHIISLITAQANQHSSSSAAAAIQATSSYGSLSEANTQISKASSRTLTNDIL